MPAKPPVWLPIAERFHYLTSIDWASGCWLWTGNRNKGETQTHSYGRFKSGDAHTLAHRFSYEHFVGPIPGGFELDHLCRNPPCINPLHLEPVTHAENMARGAYAMRTHCPRGHEYTPENTYLARRRNGQRFRQCRTCETARAQRRNEERKALRRSRRTTVEEFIN